MRHLIIAPYLPGPLRPRLRGFAVGLASIGDSVTVVGLDSGEPWSVPPGIDIVSVPVNRILAGARAAAALARGRSASVAWCAEPAWGVAVSARIAADRPDRIHVEHVRSASLLSELPSVPGTFDAVDSVPDLYRRIAASDPRASRRRVRLREATALETPERLLCAWAAQVVATTPGEAAAIGQRVGRGVIAIGNGIEPGREQGDPSNAPPCAVVVGRWRHPPNRDGLLWLLEEVWPAVLRRIPEARLRIVGPGLGALRATIGGRERVERAGWLPDSRGIFAGCRVALAPGFVGAGWSNKCVDALSFGVPVVATPQWAAEFPGAVEAGALRVASNPRRFALEWISFLENPDVAGEMGRRGSAWASALPGWTELAARLREPFGESRRP